MKALLVANGSLENINILKELKDKVDFILAVDGGTNHCIRACVFPNLIIGDLDSISDKNLSISKEKNITIERFPVKKDATDTELSLDYLLDKGFKDITLMGVTGSRMDHTLGNIYLLNKLKENGAKGRIIDENNIIYLEDKELILRKKDSYLSIIPLTSSGINISLKGFEYELDQVDLEFSSTIGISNRIVEEEGIINIHRGKALVIESKD